MFALKKRLCAELYVIKEGDSEVQEAAPSPDEIDKLVSWSVSVFKSASAHTPDCLATVCCAHVRVCLLGVKTFQTRCCSGSAPVQYKL